MLIYILTYKRPEVRTLKYISPERMKNVRLVVQPTDICLDGKYENIKRLVLPWDVTNVASTRQHIVDTAALNGDEKIMQLDDDLTIGVLKEQGAYNLRDADFLDMEQIFDRVEFLLDSYPHVGATARNEAHLNFDRTAREVGRAIRFHGMNVPLMVNMGININRVPTIEDYDFILQILRKGIPNVIDCQTYVGDGGSNAEGGCSEMRAELKDGEAARLLQSYHPEFVTLVEKETKVAGGVWKRTDVRVAWKKAYESGLAIKSSLL